MFQRRVLRAVDDAKVLAPPAFDRWLNQTSAISRDELQRLHDHTLAASGSEFLPPCDPFLLARVIAKIDNPAWSAEEKLRIGGTQSSRQLHVPAMILVQIHHALTRQHVGTMRALGY